MAYYFSGKIYGDNKEYTTTANNQDNPKIMILF